VASIRNPLTFGTLSPIWDTHAPLTPEDTDRLTKSFLDEDNLAHLEKVGDIDFAYQTDFGRFRASVVKQRLGYEIVFRIIDHILTLEDPIEYVFESTGCHVNQREVGSHTESFPKALRGALREDPDIIMVGEMRNLETIQLALTAAETGHLVLATLHTGNAPRTLDRVLDVFPVDQREQIRIMVSESLRGVISQQLVPKADGTGRSMALELLVNTAAVAATIRDGKTFMLPGIMQTGKNVGMITMDESLRNLYSQGLVTQEEVLFRCEDKQQMKLFFQS